MIKLLQVALTVLAAVKRFVNSLRRYDNPKRLVGDYSLVDGSVDYPGHLAFANKGGEYFHGCRVARFKNAQALNEFCLPGNAGHLSLVAEILPQDDGSLVVVFTKKLSREDMEDIEEFNRNMHHYFEQKKFERTAAKAQEEEAKQKQEEQDKADLELGRKYRARVAKIRSLPAGSAERKDIERELNSGGVD